MLNFIVEGAFLQEANVVNQSSNKAIFKMVLQTADEVNQNRRLYPRKVLEEAMAKNQERINRRAFLGELDHPVPSNNDTFDSIRQTTVMLKESSHIIRGYDWKGNHLVGELETASTPNGMILLGLLKDKSGIGMSMRGMAELERQQDVNVVKDPLLIITFDGVSLPSHKAAVVDFNEMKFESSMIMESKCGIICTPDGKCYLPEFFDRLVETKMITFFSRWI